MNEFFSSDGPLMGFMQKTGELILLGLLWFLCSLPIVTIGASSTALYYAVVKSVRKGRGYVTKEFFRSFKRNLAKGSLLTIIIMGTAALLLYYREYIGLSAAGEVTALWQLFLPENQGVSITLFIVYDGILLILAFMLVYLFPVLSRFDMKLGDIMKLSFVISIRYFYFTILILSGFVLMVVLQWNYLPAPVVLFLPGVWTYAISFLTEKSMRKYIKAPEPGVDAWYLE